MELNPVPELMRKEYDELLLDPWLVKKVDRVARLIEKNKYIEQNLEEIKRGGKKVLDIGTGTGEFLEYCRKYNNDAIGLEKWHDLKCRWNSYTRYSKIRWARQGLTVLNYDFSELILKKESAFDDKKFDVINCQHSINFIFNSCFDFIKSRPLYLNDGRWIFGADFSTSFSRFFWWCSEHLVAGGILLVASLCSENSEKYSEEILKISEKFGLGLIFNRKNLIHKWRKL